MRSTPWPGPKDSNGPLTAPDSLSVLEFHPLVRVPAVERHGLTLLNLTCTCAATTVAGMSHMKRRIASLVLALPQETEAAALPEGCNVQVFPDGEFAATDGRPASITDGQVAAWRMDADIAAALIAQVERLQTPLVVDYEHQTLAARDKGIAAPASGWLASLVYVEGRGLFGRVDWTGRAREYIAAGEYRYISPVFAFNGSGAVIRLACLALTNHPGLDGMASVAAAALLAGEPLEDHMEELLERLRWMLNLPITATAAEIVAELDKLKAQLAGDGEAAAAFAMPGLAALLAGKDAEIAALRAADPDPAKFVAVSALADMQKTIADLTARVASLSAEGKTAEIGRAIDAALADGRLHKALEPWARSLAAKDPAALTAYLGQAKPLAALSRMQTQGGEPPADPGPAALTAEEKWAADQFGYTEDQYVKLKEGK